MPIIRRKDHVLLHMGFLLVVLDVAGCGAVVLLCRVWALWRLQLELQPCFFPGRAKHLSAPRYLLRLNLKTKGEPHLQFKIRSLQEICALLGYYAASSGNFLQMGRIGCPETSRNYHYSLRNSPEELIFELLRGGSLKSRKVAYSFRRTSHDSIRRHFDYGSFCMWLHTISQFRNFSVSEDAAEEPQIPANLLPVEIPYQCHRNGRKIGEAETHKEVHFAVKYLRFL